MIGLFENLGTIKGRITSFVYLSCLTDSPHSMLSAEQFHVFSCNYVTLCRRGKILWVQIGYCNRECDSMACHPSANSKITMNPTEVKKINTKIHLLYIELTISFLKGWKCTVNFRNQCLWHKIIMKRSQVIIWRSQVIMSRSGDHVKVTGDHVKVTGDHMKVTGHHVKFVCSVLLVLSEEAKTWLLFFSFKEASPHGHFGLQV